MPDTRRFDDLTRVVSDERRHLADLESTILARLAKAGIPVVAATSEILTPYAGQIVLNTTDMLLYRYTSGVWVGFLAVGGTTDPTRHESRYHQTTLQTITNVTDTKLQFHTVDYACSDVTASGTNNQDFLLNRSGVWRCSAAIRIAAGGSGERNLFMSTGTVAGTITNRFTGASQLCAISAQLAVSTDMRLTSGTSVFAGCYQGSGGSLNTDVGLGKTNHISLTWLRP